MEHHVEVPVPEPLETLLGLPSQLAQGAVFELEKEVLCLIIRVEDFAWAYSNAAHAYYHFPTLGSSVSIDRKDFFKKKTSLLTNKVDALQLVSFT